MTQMSELLLAPENSEQARAILTNLLQKLVLFLLGSRQTPFLNATAVEIKPLVRDPGTEPIRRFFSQDTQSSSESFAK